MHIRWTKRAFKRLDAIGDWIAVDNPNIAKTVVFALFQSASQLTVFPESGRKGRIPGTRELLVPRLPYILVYKITDNRIEFVSILHTAQRWPKSL